MFMLRAQRGITSLVEQTINDRAARATRTYFLVSFFRKQKLLCSVPNLIKINQGIKLRHELGIVKIQQTSYKVTLKLQLCRE